MSTKNILYQTKICIKNYINKVFDRVYNKLPLESVDYPFVVYEIEIASTGCQNKMQLLIDIWDNRNDRLTNIDADKLISELDYLNNSEMNLSVHFAGEIKNILDMPTQDEELTRIRLIGEYDLYKVV